MSVKRRVFSIIFWIVGVLGLLFLFAWAAFEFYGKKYVTDELKKRLGPSSTWASQSFNPLTMNLRINLTIPSKAGSFPINKYDAFKNLKFSRIDYSLRVASVYADVSLLKTLFARRLLFSSLKVDGGDLNIRLISPSKDDKEIIVGSNAWMYMMLPYTHIKTKELTNETIANKVNRYSKSFLRDFVSQLLPQGEIDISGVRIVSNRKLEHRILGVLNVRAYRVHGKFYLKSSLDELKPRVGQLMLANLLVTDAYRSKPNMRLYLALNTSLLHLGVAGSAHLWFDFKQAQLSKFILKANLVPLQRRIARDIGQLSFKMYWLRNSENNWNLILSPVDVFLSKKNEHILGDLYAQRKLVDGVDSYDIFVPKFSMNALSVVKPIFNLGDSVLSGETGGFDGTVLDKMLKSVKHFHAQGGVSDLNWHYQYPSLLKVSPRDYSMALSLNDISFDPFGYVPGVKILNGRLQLDKKGGGVLFDAGSIKLPEQKLFPLGWPNTNAKGKLFWQNTPSGLSFDIPEISFYNSLPSGSSGGNSEKSLDIKKELITHLSGNFYVPKDVIGNYNIHKTTVSLIADAKGQNVAPIVPYLLPHNISSGALDWLAQGIVEVPTVAARMIWLGSIGDYPYLDGRGEFDVRVMLSNAKLKPWHDWPLVTNLYGSLDFYHDQFKAVVNSARSMNVQTKDLTVMIPHMHGHQTHWIEGIGVLQGEGSDVTNFIYNTPLKKNFSNVFDMLSVKGPVKVDLNLKAPLSKKHINLMRYFGKVDFKDNTINLFKFDLPVKNVSGEIEYNNDLLKTPSPIVGNIFDLPVNVQIGPKYNKEDNKTQNYLHLQTLLDVDKWAANFSSLNFDKNEVHGLLPVIFNATFDKGFFDAHLMSDLKGLELKLPAPFYQSVLTDRNLDANYLNKDGEVKFSFDIDNFLDARFNWQEHNIKKSLSGFVNFGLSHYKKSETKETKETKITKGSIQVTGSVPYFSQTQWADWLTKSYDPAGSSDLKNQQWQYFHGTDFHALEGPDVFIDVFIKQLNFMNQSWKDVSLNAFLNPWILLLRLNNKYDTLNGNIYIPRTTDIIGFKAIDARFDNLRVTIPSSILSKLNQSNPSNVKEAQNSKNTNKKTNTNVVSKVDIKQKDIKQKKKGKKEYKTVFDRSPNLNVTVKNFKFQNNDLGLLKFRLRHLGPNLVIPHLKVKNKLFLLTGSASSQWGKDGQISHITGKIDSQDWGELLHQLYLPRGLSKGKGNIDFNLTWNGFLTDPKVSTLDGGAGFALKDGMLDKVNMGLGRLLGLMSLDTIVRRLSLNFSDLTGKGVAFDSFSGNFNLKKGIASTNNVKMAGPALNFDMKGEVDLVNKTLDQTITVMPKVGGGLALAAGLLGGPIVGLTTLLGEQILSHTVLKGKGAKYHYVGPWSNPKLEEV